MKAFVLAAGLGTRLRPLTNTYAKPALPLAHKPMLRRVIESLAAAGIRDIRINSHHLPHTIDRVVEDATDLHVSLSVQHEPELLGTGGALLASRDWLGDEPVLIVNGDAVSDLSFAGLIDAHRKSDSLATMALRIPMAGERFGPVEINSDGEVVRILEDGPELPGTQVRMFCGIHILQASFLELLEPSGFSCVVRRGYLEALRRSEKIQSYHHAGYFADAGTPASFLDAHWHVLRGEMPTGSGIGPSGRRASTWWVESQVDYGADVQLAGYVSIGKGAQVKSGALVENSLIEAGAVVEDGEQLVGAIRLSSGATLFRD